MLKCFCIFWLYTCALHTLLKPYLCTILRKEEKQDYDYRIERRQEEDEQRRWSRTCPPTPGSTPQPERRKCRLCRQQKHVKIKLKLLSYSDCCAERELAQDLIIFVFKEDTRKGCIQGNLAKGSLRFAICPSVPFETPTSGSLVTLCPLLVHGICLLEWRILKASLENVQDSRNVPHLPLLTEPVFP